MHYQCRQHDFWIDVVIFQQVSRFLTAQTHKRSFSATETLLLDVSVNVKSQHLAAI